MSKSLAAAYDTITDLLTDLRDHSTPNSGDWLAKLAGALRPRRRDPEHAATLRFGALLAVLRARPDLALALGAHLNTVLSTRSHRILYSDAWLLGSRTFVSALTTRLLGRILPPAVDAEFLRDVIYVVFDRPRDHVWLTQVSREDWAALLALLDVDGEAFAPARRQCRGETLEALRLVSHRLAAAGSEPELLRYLPALARHESPFLAQSDEVRDFLERCRDESCAQAADDGHLEVLFGQCDDYIDRIRRRSREQGVAVNLVWLLARLEKLVGRARALHGLLVPRQPATAVIGSTDTGSRLPVVDFFLVLIRQETRRHSVGDLFSGSFEMLARRVTEHASKSGEHYITESRAEYFAMFRAAAGAGVIIAMMAMIKILITRAGLPPVWEAVAYSLNFGIGFIIVHVLHLVIATKQPAMTAAALAASLDDTQGREARLRSLEELSAKVSRSQMIAIAGNMAIGLVVALSIGMVGARLLDWQPLETVKAQYLLDDLHPWRSLALLHAAIAGFFLFLSGLLSGYYDNQALYHRVPERLQRVRWLRAVFGTVRLTAFSEYIRHNLGALMGNFLFGCMLGCTPVVGALLGLPLDVRHVALSASNLAYAVNALEFSISFWTVFISTVGVLLVGLTNLGVSFALALRVALRSRGIRPQQTRGLAARVLNRFLSQPREFLWAPPLTEPLAAAAGTGDNAPPA